MKYVLVSDDTNSHIAVIGIENPSEIIQDKNFKERLETALEEDFGEPVKIQTFEEHSLQPIYVTLTVLIGDEDNQFSGEIELHETWLY